MIISFRQTLVTHQNLCRESISLNFVISNSYKSMLEIFEEGQLVYLNYEFFQRCERRHLFESWLCHSLAVTSSKFCELFEPVPPYANEDDNDAWGCGEGEWLLLWINHVPPPLPNPNQTRPGTRWRLKCSNWLVINTAGLVNEIVLRQKMGSLHPPSPPWDLALSDTRQPQGGCQAVPHPLKSRKESSQWEACYFLSFL